MLLRVPDDEAQATLDSIRDNDPYTRFGVAQYEAMALGPCFWRGGPGPLVTSPGPREVPRDWTLAAAVATTSSSTNTVPAPHACGTAALLRRQGTRLSCGARLFRGNHRRQLSLALAAIMVGRVSRALWRAPPSSTAARRRSLSPWRSFRWFRSAASIFRPAMRPRRRSPRIFSPLPMATTRLM